MKIEGDKIRALMKQYGFATAVLGVLALMALIILGKDLLIPKQGAGQMAGGPPGAAGGGGQARPGGMPGGAGGAGRPGGGGMDMPTVGVTAVQQRVFADSIQALGTAEAKESITITAKVQDVIRAIRFESGQRVAKGQVLVELANVEQAADLNEARAQLVVDQRAYARFKELADRGFATKAKLDETQAAYERSKANVAGLQSRINDRTIRAPFAGIVGLRTASPGQLASPGQALGTLDDVSAIKLDFDVPEPQLAKMVKGAPLEARTAAYPSAKFVGAINEIDSRINTTTRTVRVRALLPNKDGRLKPGMLMTVNVLSNQKSALSVPEMAMTELGSDAYVYRVHKQGPMAKVEQAYVKPGRRTDGYIEILDGLDAGDQVIVEGVQRVRPGQPVKVKPLAGEGGDDGAAQAGPGAGAKPASAKPTAGKAGGKADAEAVGVGGEFSRGRS
jgi:membrane fusion protein, multidrug efflux system